MWQWAPVCLAAWLLGTVLQLQQATVWSLAWSLGLGAGALLVLTCLAFALHLQRSSRWRKQTALGHGAFQLAVFAATVLLSLATLNFRCGRQLQEALAPHLEGQDLRLLVEVASLPHVNANGVKFRGRVLRAALLDSDAAVKVPEWAELTWSEWEAPGGMDLPLWQSLTPGDQWQFQVRLKVPHGSLNPGGFDEELRLWALGISATGSIRAGKTQLQPRKLSSSWHSPVDQLRQRVRTQIALHLRTDVVGAPTNAGLIAALVMGDQAAIAPADWQTFRATGVAHLMSISGLHITLLAWLASLLIGRAWRASVHRGSVLCLRCPAPWVASAAGVVLASLYAVFCGWGLPAQRTILMLLTVSLLRWQGLRWPWYGVWGLALWVVALWDPWALLQASFWLSFVAVGALILSDPGTTSRRTKVVNSGDEVVHESRLARLRLILVTRLLQPLLALSLIHI
jgi:competence protein ComEC